VLGHLLDDEAVEPQQLRGAARGEDLDAVREQGAGEIDYAILVRDADQRPADLDEVVFQKT